VNLEELNVLIANKIWLWTVVDHFRQELGGMVTIKALKCFAPLWSIKRGSATYVTDAGQFIQVLPQEGDLPVSKTYMTCEGENTRLVTLSGFAYTVKRCVIQASKCQSTRFDCYPLPQTWMFQSSC